MKRVHIEDISDTAAAVVVKADWRLSIQEEWDKARFRWPVENRATAIEMVARQYGFSKIDCKCS